MQTQRREPVASSASRGGGPNEDLPPAESCAPYVDQNQSAVVAAARQSNLAGRIGTGFADGGAVAQRGLNHFYVVARSRHILPQDNRCRGQADRRRSRQPNDFAALFELLYNLFPSSRLG